MPKVPLKFSHLYGVLDKNPNSHAQLSFFSGYNDNSTRTSSHILIAKHNDCSLYGRISVAPQPGWSLPLEPEIKSAYLIRLKNVLVLPHGVQKRRVSDVAIEPPPTLVRVQEISSSTSISIPQLNSNTDLLIAESGVLFNDSLSRYRYLSGAVEIDKEGSRGSVQYSNNAGLDIITEPSIFLGPISNHFGHLLVETTSRLWAFNSKYGAEVSNRKPLALASHGLTGNSYSEMQQMPRDFIANILPSSASNNIKIVRNATLCRDLLIPKAMSPFFHSSSMQFAETMERYSNHAQTLHGGHRLISNKKIYISRSRAGQANRSGLEKEQETRIENHMIGLSYYIMHPELISIEESALMMKGATKIVSTWGSQLHRIAFCSPGADVLRIALSNFKGETDTLIAMSVRINLYDLVIQKPADKFASINERNLWSYANEQEGDIFRLINAFDQL